MAKRAEFEAVFPVLPARDVGASVRFYVDRLGFELLFQDTPDAPRYAAVRRGGVKLHLQWQSEEDFQKGTAGQCMLRLLVDDPDALYEEYKNKGVFHDRTRLRDTAWGTREFAFFDPDRNGLTFLRHR